MTNPVLIIGAGVSGLLLAQHLRRENIPFRIFERDADLTTRGVGWGLTLHWSLPAIRALIPEGLVQRLPEAYVDRIAVENGAISTFPFFDLSTGELKASTPKAPESQRIRVTREGIRKLLATGIDIEWGRSFKEFEDAYGVATVKFDDGASVTGSVLVACDGGSSRVRRALFPGEYRGYEIPVRLMGAKMVYTTPQIERIRKLDPFFLQGTASKNNSFMYISMLDAPENSEESSDGYSCQICVSWPYKAGFMGHESPLEFPTTNEGNHELVQALGDTWAEPFHSFVRQIPPDTEIKHLGVTDFAPPKGLRTSGRAVLMGDSLHNMAMYRGEGANHAIVDVLDFAQKVVPKIRSGTAFSDLRTAMDEYEDAVVERTRPAVLASRRACLDGHDWSRIDGSSPLLTRRQMMLEFEQE